MIDAHLHLWDLDRAEYDWLDDGIGPINRTVTCAEVAPSLARAGVDAVILVQAADNWPDTELMLDLAALHREVVGVVAYLPLGNPAQVAAGLERCAAEPVIVGVRNLIHTYADPRWLLRPDVDESLGLLENAGYTFDLVTALPDHLALLPTLSKRHPNLRIVLDHLGKPPIPVGADDRWWTELAAAAENPLVAAKVSGLYAPGADPGAWTVEALAPVVDHALAVFGPERLMYGGDWPLAELAGGYDRVWAGLQSALGQLAPGERDRVFGGTAVDWYRLGGSARA